jgi:iron complex outermembrane receptor protein
VAAFVAITGVTIPSRPATAQEIQPAPPIRREIQGSIIDSATSQPIGGAQISVAEAKVATTADSAGRYRIAGAFPPAVTLTIRRIGYGPVTKRVDLARGIATVNVALTQSASMLEKMTVKADSAAEFLRAAQPTATMTQEDVQQQRGQTLGETIKAMPGVAIIQYGPSIAKPVVRGLHSQRIVTVNDGVPQEGQQWGGEHAPEIDAFAANKIEVIRGPASILYGSGALGGVVRVIPRPLPTSGGMGAEVSTNAFANNRQVAASALVEGANLPVPWLGALGWRAQMSARRAGDAKTPTYYLPNTGFKELDYNAAVGLTRPWGSSLLSYSHFGTDLGLYVGAHVGNLDDLNRAMQFPLTTSSFGSEIARPDQKVTHDLIAWHTEVGAPTAGRLEISYGFQNNLRKEFDNHGFAVGARPAFALQLYTHSLDVQYHHKRVGPLSGTIGVAGMRQGNLSPGRSFLIPQYRLYTSGVFGFEQVAISRLTLTAGARLDTRWQHAYQFGAPVVISPEDQRSYAGPSGSLGASFAFTDSWSLSSSVAQAWRPPNVNELFSQGVHHGTAQYEIGDTTLVPERSLNADLTLRHLGARSRLELSAYQNRINDYIFLRPREPISTVRGAYPAYNYAHTNARLRGIEITGQVDPVSWLSLYANGNLVRGVDLPTGEPLYDMPADRATASVRVFRQSSTRFVTPYVEVGTTLVRRQDQVPLATIYKLPTAGYALLNFEIGATAINIGGTRLEPNLAIRNVLDTRYRDYLSRYRLFVDEPGRDVVLRLTVPFGAKRP